MTASTQRVFLTQSSRSRSTEETTASTATTLTMSSSTGTAPSARSRTATAAESNQRMATERHRRAEGARRLARLERASSELASYGRRRFDASAGESTAASPSSLPGPAAAGGGSKCGLSPYTTVVMETETTPSPRRPDSGERLAGRMRARLMNELRLRQSEQRVRFRHDRTAQELTQEGCLTGRAARTTGGYPWPTAYKYTPFPEPRLRSWVVEERRQRTAAAVAMAAAEEAEADNAEAETVLIELAIQGAPQPPPQLFLELPAVTVTQQPQPQPRKASDSLLATSTPFAGLAPSDAAGIKWQRSKSQAHVQKQLHRQFSVSTIGEEERSRRRAQLQTLAQVCAKLNSNRQSAGREPAGKSDKKQQQIDAIDYLVDEIEATVANGGPLFNSDIGEPLPALACPGSLDKSRQHQTRTWLRQQRFCRARQPPIIG